MDAGSQVAGARKPRVATVWSRRQPPAQRPCRAAGSGSRHLALAPGEESVRRQVQGLGTHRSRSWRKTSGTLSSRHWSWDTAPRYRFALPVRACRQPRCGRWDAAQDRGVHGGGVCDDQDAVLAELVLPSSRRACSKSFLSLIFFPLLLLFICFQIAFANTPQLKFMFLK